jgi:hypothetical protein
MFKMGLHDPFWTFKTQVMAKKRARSQMSGIALISLREGGKCTHIQCSTFPFPKCIHILLLLYVNLWAFGIQRMFDVNMDIQSNIESYHGAFKY